MSPAERELRVEHAALLAERDRLGDQFTPPGSLPASLELLPNEEKALKALMSREQWTKEALLTSIFYDMPVDDVPEIKIIDFLIFRLREKLSRYGIEIETFPRKGYQMAPHMRAKAALLIEREFAAGSAAAWAGSTESDVRPAQAS